MNKYIYISGMASDDPIIHLCEKYGFKISNNFRYDINDENEPLTSCLHGLEQAEFVIADLSYLPNINVGFEIGYALARGKSVIGVDIKKNVNSLIKQCAFIVNSINDLEKVLKVYE